VEAPKQKKFDTLLGAAAAAAVVAIG